MERHSRAYKEALIEALSERRWAFHITAELPPEAIPATLERLIRDWAARVDHFYLGRNWSRREDRRMRGVVFFETRPHPHAHMIVIPPMGASPFHFLLHARLWFVRHEAPDLRRVSPRPVTQRGRMKVQKIEDGSDGLRRVLGYDMKEMEYRASAIGEWKFLSDLSGG